MKKNLLISGAICLILSWAVPTLGQQDSDRKASRKEAKDSTWSDWNLRLSPYVWLLGINGQIAITPNPVQLPEIPPPVEQLPSGRSIYDIDLSPKDVRHSLKFALMLSGQYMVKRFVTQFNVSSIVLETNAEAPFDYVFTNSTLRLAYAGGDLGAGYRVIRNEKFEFDVLLGLKFVYTKVGLTTDVVGQVPVEVKAARLWTDPVIATNLAYRPHKRIEIAAYGDLGYTLFNDNLTYQLSANVFFLISRHIYISAGYKTYYLDFTKKEAFFAGSLQGWIIKFGFQF